VELTVAQRPDGTKRISSAVVMDIYDKPDPKHKGEMITVKRVPQRFWEIWDEEFKKRLTQAKANIHADGAADYMEEHHGDDGSVHF